MQLGEHGPNTGTVLKFHGHKWSPQSGRFRFLEVVKRHVSAEKVATKQPKVNERLPTDKGSATLMNLAGVTSSLVPDVDGCTVATAMERVRGRSFVLSLRAVRRFGETRHLAFGANTRH